jgi:hypothetical protein
MFFAISYQVVGPSITAGAAQLRNALTPALGRSHEQHVPIRQLAASGLEDIQRVFGYLKTRCDRTDPWTSNKPNLERAVILRKWSMMINGQMRGKWSKTGPT